ncbi:MAG: M48 family metallopeptidase [Candidatus Limimorpha sp.]
MVGVLNIKGKELKFELLHSKRQSVCIKVRQDGVIVFYAPESFSEKNLPEFLQHHWRWFSNNYDRLYKSSNVNTKYVDRDTLHYLGKEYSMEIIEDNSCSIQLCDEQIIVHCNSKQQAEKTIINWYMQKANEKYRELLPPIAEKFRKYNVSPSKITIRDMRSRWGSCSKKGNISLNLQLIKLREECIKLVMIHEMCHLIYFNHQKEFHSLMDEMMPDWKFWSKQLTFL